MEKKGFCLFVDDDSVYVRAIADLLKSFFYSKQLDLEICMSLEEVVKVIPIYRNSELKIAIVDLWFINKKTNTNEENLGIDIIFELRKVWPNCYIFVLSGHLNNGESALKNIGNIALIEKPISIDKLTFNIDDILNQMNQ